MKILSHYVEVIFLVMMFLSSAASSNVFSGVSLNAPSALVCSSSAIVASITASRTSGAGPLAVHFDATATTDSGGNDLQRELFYVWDFDDAGAGIWTESGQSKEIDFGYITGHVFENGGVYDVMLTVYAPDGSCDQATSTITVTDDDTQWAGTDTVCIANSAPTAGVGGCPSGAATSTSSDFDAAVAACKGDDKRCLLNGGDTFTASTRVSLDGITGPLLIDAYGTGKANVSVGAGFSTSDVFRCNSSCSDIRIRNLDFGAVGTAGTDIVARANSTTTITNMLIQGVENTSGGQLSLISDPGGTTAQNDLIFHIENTWLDSDGGAGNYTVFLNSGRSVTMGNRFDDSTAAEHVLRMTFAYKSVVAHNYLARAATGKHVLKLHANEHGGGGVVIEDSDYVVVRRNEFVGDLGSPLVDIGPQDQFSDEWVNYVLVEDNFCDSGTENQICIRLAVAGNTVARNNVFNLTDRATGTTGIAFEKRSGFPTASVTNIHAFGNTCFNDNAGITEECVELTSGDSNKSCVNTMMIGDGTLDACVPGTGSETSSRESATRPFETDPPTARAHFKITAGATGVDDAGTCVDGLSRDFDGDVRPQGATCDIGADEEETP